ncbi:hypothetical protein AHiyo4_27110 [Arthrobacter sp. Hiyo4]|nr:hypothetical protein AHiyo4_27110 [Arthrobacter sp. Hiyo4]
MAGPADPFSCLNEVDLFADLTAQEIEAMDLMAPPGCSAAGNCCSARASP